MATIRITNTLTTVIAGATGVEAVISPTGITKPCTPIQEYVGDMATIVDGTLLIPAYNKVQMLSIPFGAYTEFEVTDPKEINYWENIKVDGAKVEVAEGNLAPSVKYTFTKVDITGAGTSEDPYVPAFAENKYYAPAEGGGEPAQNATAIANNSGWGTTTKVVYTRKENVLPTNNVSALGA